MPFLPHSLRWRLLLFHGSLLAALLTGFAFSIHLLESERASRQLEASLRSELALLSDTLRSAPERGPQVRNALPSRLAPLESARFNSRLYYAIWMQENQPVATSKNAPPEIPKPTPDSPSFRSRPPYLEAVLFAAPVESILVGALPDPNPHNPLAASLGLAGSLVLLAGLLADNWILARSLKPISRITHTARQIAQGHLSERIPTPDSPTHSELNQLALTLNHTFAQLEAAFARQTRFITDAAHELRTPVAVLLTQTQSILARERSPDEYREALQACLRAAQRMRTLSEALLELSQSNLPANDLKTIDLAAAASECVDFILPLAHAKSLQITRDIPATPCLAHPPSLARALTCLLENAVEYTPENGWIRLTTRTTPAWSVLQIANSGPGIPPQELPLMFEPFHRTDKSRTLGQKIHCGLGLPITKNLLMAQKAEIQVESSPGSETVFTLRFRPAGTLADSGSAALL